MKPMTSDEQQAALGNVRRIPQQIDLLTGDVVLKPPKRGNGSHVVLKPCGIEKPVVPGMASYAGEGPAGKRCEDCRWFGTVAIHRPSGDIDEKTDACVRAAQLFGRLPMVRTDIKHCSACKLFVQLTEPHGIYRIRKDGETVDGNGRTIGRPQF